MNASLSDLQSEYSQSFALIVGIDEYKHASPLSFAKNDATAIANALEHKFGFEKSKITLLLDKDATLGGIRDSYLSFADPGALGPDDRLIFFFAGHGHTVRGIRGEVGFLVPYEGNPGETKTLLRWDDLTRNADLISAKHIFFLMDACYGGLALQRAPSGNMRFLGDMLRRQARQVLTAGKADEVVADGGGVRPGHSIFTAHLLNALEGAAATKEGILTANGVMAYVYEKVGRDEYSHQTPHFGYVAGDGDFIFNTTLLKKLQSEAQKSDATRDPATEGAADVLVNTSSQTTDVAIGKDSPVVSPLKDFLSEPSKRIKLDDFVVNHVRRFLEAIDQRYFPTQGAQLSKEEFTRRVKLYEDAAKELQQIVILLSRWASSEQLLTLERLLNRVAEADKGNAGLVVWRRLNWYPVLFLIYSAGISALVSRRYDALQVVLTTIIRPESARSQGDQAIIVPTVEELTEINDAFKNLPNRERNFVARSEHLFSVLQPELEDLLFLGRGYEDAFDAFEVLLALVYADVTDRDWGPIGRFGWKQRRGEDAPFNKLVEQAKKEGQDWEPLRAGLFRGSLERFIEVEKLFRGNFKHLHWY